MCKQYCYSQRRMYVCLHMHVIISLLSEWELGLRVRRALLKCFPFLEWCDDVQLVRSWNCSGPRRGSVAPHGVQIHLASQASAVSLSYFLSGPRLRHRSLFCQQAAAWGGLTQPAVEAAWGTVQLRFAISATLHQSCETKAKSQNKHFLREQCVCYIFLICLWWLCQPHWFT